MSEEIKTSETTEPAEIKEPETVEAAKTEAPVEEKKAEETATAESTETKSTETKSTETKSTETKSTETRSTDTRSTDKRSDQRREGGYQQRRPYRDGKSDGKFSRFKRKGCRFCRDKVEIDYKNASILEKFITDGGKILPRRVTGTCAKHQRSVARAIKRARIIALLTFIEK